MNFPLPLQTIRLGNATVKLYVPDAQAVKSAYQQGFIPSPYWSQVWPAAVALADFLFRHPDYTNSKNVLEIGAGLGLPSLVAARNAASVLCTDVAPEAVNIVQQSAALHQLSNFKTAVADWMQLPQELKADILLLSDINYQPEAFAVLQKMLNHFLQTGTTILLSTPQRLMARQFVAPLLQHCTRQEEVLADHQNTKTAISILVLQ